jgi:hypothetical protein
MNTQRTTKRPWTLAAPSCVLPAGIAENCAFLAQDFDEIGLAFFETEACLAYTEADFPADLALLPVSWHMHLPLDLPWDAGVGAVADTVLRLRERAAHVAPGLFVLHPPQQPVDLANLVRLLAAGGLAPSQVLVENIAGRDLALHWPVIEAENLGVCLDLGHMLVHGQQDFLNLPGLFARTRMLHLNAPDPSKPSRHAALSVLDAPGRALCARLLEGFGPGGVVMLELFGQEALYGSLRVLDALCGAGETKEAHA